MDEGLEVWRTRTHTHTVRCRRALSQASKGKGKGAAAATPAAAASASTAEVDKACPKANNKGVSVCAGHDVKLNQTNIAANNNKFYILQVGLAKRWLSRRRRLGLR